MGNREKGKLKKGLCSICNKICYYIPGRNWFGKNEVVCNGCINYEMKNKHKEKV